MSHRHAVGDCEVVVLADGYRTFPLPDALVVNADRGEVNKALVAAGMPADEMTIHFNPAAVRIEGRTILIDTGNGPRAAAEQNSTRGWLPRSMAHAGIAAEDVDTVVISHFHGDHINGLLDAQGSPAFPNAAILVPAPEWAFWLERTHEDDQRMRGIANHARQVFEPVRDRVKTFAWDDEIAPGLKAVATPGHTPGHTSFRLASAGQSLFIQSDVTNNPALFVRHPGWHASFDIDGDKAETGRREVYDMLAARRMPVLGFHYPFPSLAQVEIDGDGYRAVPL
jgi:glyoxylase-like metal-dependent hydrolase (beta-lactamase superfamily II)